MSALSGRGDGFVHPNTPAAIHYTNGQKISLSDLRRRSTRVECAVLPPTQSLWRLANHCYTALEGFTAFASDLEDERAGEGPVLPPLAANSRKRPRYSCTTGEPTCFFVGRHTTATPPHASPAEPASETASASGSTAVKAGTGNDKKIARDTAGGIAIVSHHKISGKGEFVYPDYDGVLSSGVVPEVVVTADERQEEEERKKYCLTPLDMTPEELEAFEALQGLWRARAASRSAQGAKWRAISEGVQSGRDGQPEDADVKIRARAAGHRPPRGDDHAVKDDGAGEAEEANIADHSDREFAEALRLADELLRFM